MVGPGSFAFRVCGGAATAIYLEDIVETDSNPKQSETAFKPGSQRQVPGKRPQRLYRLPEAEANRENPHRSTCADVFWSWASPDPKTVPSGK